MFQRTFTNDIYHIEERLKEYDPFLSLEWNPETGEHRIYDDMIKFPVMKIPQKGFEWLDARIVAHIKKIHTANGFNALEEMERHNDKVERDWDKYADDFAKEMAKDMAKPLQEAHFYGRTEGTIKDTVRGIELEPKQTDRENTPDN